MVQSASQQRRESLVVGNDAEQGKPRCVDGVVDGRVQGVQEPLLGAVDNQMQLAVRKGVQLHDRALRVAQAGGIARGHDHGAICAAGGEHERIADAGGGVNQAEVELSAYLVQQLLHLCGGRQRGGADGSGEQIKVGVERVADDRLRERAAEGDHVGKVHQRAVGHSEIEVEIAQPDVAVEQQRLFPEPRESHAGERGE